MGRHCNGTAVNGTNARGVGGVELEVERAGILHKIAWDALWSGY